MPKSVWIGLFLAFLAIGVMFGVARDLYSRERAVLKGTVTEIDAGGAANKSTQIRSPALKVRLDGGAIVDVAAKQTAGITSGQTVNVAEMVMPWGQVWYKLKSE